MAPPIRADSPSPEGALTLTLSRVQERGLFSGIKKKSLQLELEALSAKTPICYDVAGSGAVRAADGNTLRAALRWSQPQPRLGLWAQRTPAQTGHCLDRSGRLGSSRSHRGRLPRKRCVPHARWRLILTRAPVTPPGSHTEEPLHLGLLPFPFVQQPLVLPRALKQGVPPTGPGWLGEQQLAEPPRLRWVRPDAALRLSGP